MRQRSRLTLILALIGSVVVWFPIAAMLLTSVIRTIRAGVFGMDYLMPAELFPFILAGSGLLVWAAWRAGMRKRLIAGAMVLAVASLVLSQGLAEVTGLAAGATPMTGWRFALVMALLALYDAAVIALGVGGVLLVRDLATRDAAAITL